jgi:hypothetical protein
VIDAVPRTGDWRLVAPWWRWTAQGGDPRTTKPAFQKYDTSDFVNDFLANPQHCLRIDDTDDRVQELVSKPVPKLGARLRVLSDHELRPTSMLKLFLPSHKRFYLVVCELHCEKAGFPNAHRDEVCQAGFVVRRRRFDVGKGSVTEARNLIDRVERAVRVVDELDAEIASRTLEIAESPEPFSMRYRAGAGAPAATLEPLLELSEPQQLARDELIEARTALRSWASASGAAGMLEGWIPGDDHVGRWQSVKERPGKTIVEQVFPLFPLVPTPATEQHIGPHRAIWFGTVTTSSADHDARGTARFDERSVYEVRCFVRRHEPDKPKNPVAQDCCGELVWSRPTERYQLAPHFDLTGTANQPVTVQLPDIPRLKAQAAAMPIGKGAAVKMSAPAGSSMRNVTQSGGSLGSAQICSLSIPLITIVATFVLNIFLPIVVAILQLYALLRLKFCIPPSISLDASAMLALEGTPAQIDARASATVAVKNALTVSLGSSGAADDALQGYTPSAFAPTLTASARLQSPPGTDASISARIFEEELAPA